MKSSKAAVLAAGKIVASVPGCSGFTAAAAEFVSCHFESVQEAIGGEDGSTVMDQVLARLHRRASKIIVPGADGLITEGDVIALHAHLKEVGEKLRKGGCAAC